MREGEVSDSKELYCKKGDRVFIRNGVFTAPEDGVYLFNPFGITKIRDLSPTPERVKEIIEEIIEEELKCPPPYLHNKD